MTREKVVYWRRVNGYSMDFDPGWVGGFERDAELDWAVSSEGNRMDYVVEFGYYGSEVKDIFTVVKEGKYSGSIKVFGSREDMVRYLNGEGRDIHGGEFLRKDYDNPGSVFHASFERRTIKKRR